MFRIFSVFSLVLTFILASTAAAQRDIRDEYGTRSLEAAKQLGQAVQLSEAKKYKEALAAVDAAILADPKCQRAHFRRSLILADMGKIPESLEAGKKCLSDDVNRSQQISALAAVNVGLTYGRLQEYEDSAVWLTRGILEDYNNDFKQRGKAYRNLGITLEKQERFLTAALAVALAYQDKAPNVDMKMVMEYFRRAENQNQDAANLLYFGDKAPKLEKRAQEAKLALATLNGTVSDPILDLLPDPQGRYVIAIPGKSSHFYKIATEDKLDVKKVAVKSQIVCATLMDGQLYAVMREPSRIERLDVETGQPSATFELKGAAPTSIAVFPAKGLAFYPEDRIVRGLNLQTGATFTTEVPGQVLVGDPTQRFIYSYTKPENRGGGSGHIIVNGRPVYFRSTVTDWQQTTLFKAAVVPNGLLMAGVRDNAASNGNILSVSPDGNWVAVSGGGGWRPTQKGQGGGYGVAVFNAHNLEQLQGFFPTDAYPLGVSFNPVTAQVAALRGADGKTYHLSDGKSATPITARGEPAKAPAKPGAPAGAQNSFNGHSTWSGNGRYLLVANGGSGGLTAFENSMSGDEKTKATTWWKALPAPTPLKQAAPVATFKALEELKTFALKEPSREELSKALAKAEKEGRTERPGRWQQYQPYMANKDVAKVINAALQNMKPNTPASELGVAIFQLRKALPNNVDSVPLNFFLAEALRRRDQPEEAEKHYLAVIRGDQGRTEFSHVSLNQLAQMQAKRDKPLAALDCLATSLYLDKANAGTLSLTIPLLKKNKFDAEADQFAKLASTLPVPTSTELPKLPKPTGESKKYTAAEMYKKAVWSVVLVETNRGSGSGFCVGKPDIIVTNEHVIHDASTINVSPFIHKDDKLVRMPKIHASVLYRSEKEDLAVLVLEQAPKHLEPLVVAAATPGPGERIYAIGSPGFDGQVLEQTISNGIISARNREIDGKPYVQHTAGVNPGNSGGPLLDEECRVVGMVTLKARLENVSFAIPVESIRKVFKSQ